MLTKLILTNFKRFEHSEIELGNPVVFIGPNNSGKTTALQALALWEAGVKRWLEKRGDKPAPKKRPGVTLNRRDLLALPVPSARYLWRDLHLRDVERSGGKTKQTKNVLIEIAVEGVDQGRMWRCGMDFDYANEESFYCRPPRSSNDSEHRMGIPEAAKSIEIAFLPPMSGLTPNEVRLDPGAIQVRLGEGRTAETLRNLCYQTWEKSEEDWGLLTERMEKLFGVVLDPPEYVAERGELTMSYREPSGIRLDLSAAGRGLQQTLLLLSYLAVRPRSVLLLDEPDAHLEILRQRQIYRELTQAADRQGSQVIVASHSEVLLNEAADRDVVVAFVGAPHRIDDRGAQVAKSLKWIGFEEFYQAEINHWVLYLEGATDLAILQELALTLKHPVSKFLDTPFVHYVENQPQRARDHFYGLREAIPDLEGILVVDRMDKDLHDSSHLTELMWKAREIENYLARPAVLQRYVQNEAEQRVAGPLFVRSEAERLREVMQSCIEDLVPPVALRDQEDPWWREAKASDEFLDRVFERYYAKLNLPNLMRKSDYHRLARFVDVEEVHPDVIHVLDEIQRVGEVSRERATGR